MTLIVLGLAWIFTAALVSPAARNFVSTLRPRFQVVIAFGSTLALVVIPASAAVTTLLGELGSIGGSPFVRCGRLVAAILTEPLSRPLTTTAFATAVATPVVLAVGFLSAWRRTRTTRPLLRGATAPIVRIRSDESVVFTAGLLRPRIVVSDSFLRSSAEEVRTVVLAHEEAHCRGRHPLILFVAEGLSRTVPLPPLRWALADLRFALEAVADERAARTIGNRALVAETIAGVALAIAPAPCGFEGDEVRRVRRLLASSPGAHAVFGVALAAGIIAILAFASGHAVHCGSGSIDQLSVVQCRMSASD